MTGTIKRLIRDKGFGFIKDDEGPTEFFFHRSSLARGVDFTTLVEGERVAFVEAEGAKGPRADQVERA